MKTQIDFKFDVNNHDVFKLEGLLAVLKLYITAYANNLNFSFG